MTRIVYVGGFSGGPAGDELQAALCGLANAEDIDAFTFAEAMRRPGMVHRATLGVGVYTHSAGMMALRFTNPERSCSFNPPLPRTVLDLTTRGTARKTRGMFSRGYSEWGREGVTAALRFSAGSAAELACHPLGNFSMLGQIATTNAFDEARHLVERGVQTELVFTSHDDYFSPNPEDIAAANDTGVRVTVLDGEHDELVLRPTTFISNYGIRAGLLHQPLRRVAHRKSAA